jgi:hypothetical protein
MQIPRVNPSHETWPPWAFHLECQHYINAINLKGWLLKSSFLLFQYDLRHPGNTYSTTNQEPFLRCFNLFSSSPDCPHSQARLRPIIHLHSPEVKSETNIHTTETNETSIAKWWESTKVRKNSVIASLHDADASQVNLLQRLLKTRVFSNKKPYQNQRSQEHTLRQAAELRKFTSFQTANTQIIAKHISRES